LFKLNIKVMGNHIHFIDGEVGSGQERPCHNLPSGVVVTLYFPNGSSIKKTIIKQACWPFKPSCKDPNCACFDNLPDGTYNYSTSEIICGKPQRGSVTVSGGNVIVEDIGGMHGCPLPHP
jgi:hypothetical protein